MPARLFVDIQTIQSARHGDRGIPRFATELSRALLAADAPVAALALNPLRPFPRRLHPELARAPQLTWNTATAFRRARADGPLHYVVTSPFEDEHPVEGVLAPHANAAPRVVMVYDLIPEVLGYVPHDREVRPYKSRRAWIRDADLLVTLSEHTRQDVVEHWEVDPERVAVIGAAAAPSFCPPTPGDDPGARVRRALPAIARPVVLSVTGWLWHKNPETLIDAWARLDRGVRDEHQLVLACTLPATGRKALAERVESRGLAPDDVVLTGFVSDDVLLDLYRTSGLFVLPSRYEGFGLPVLEAIAAGGPAITSNASSLPEILGWPAATFSPDDPDELAALIARALTDTEYRARLVEVCRGAARRHTWDQVAHHLLDACSRLPQGGAVPGPPRLAVVGPFPPSRSTRARANERMTRHLAARCELDCFVEGGAHSETARARQPGPFRSFPARGLGSVLNPASYDAIVYTIGTGYETVETRRLAAAYPGVVVADDVDGAALVANARATVVEPDPERAAAALLELPLVDLEPPRPAEAPPPRSMAAG